MQVATSGYDLWTHYEDLTRHNPVVSWVRTPIVVQSFIYSYILQACTLNRHLKTFCEVLLQMREHFLLYVLYVLLGQANLIACLASPPTYIWGAASNFSLFIT